MDLQRGRPDHIEDAIVTFHDGSWFYWSDNQNKTFDDFESDFLDFSESNPFGDIS